MDGLHYEDDLGMPLSRYRFSISTRVDNGSEWAGHVFALLAQQTDLDLLWLENMQHVVKNRTARVKVEV